MDTEAIKFHIEGLLKAIGEDPEREGLRETPARVAAMLEEVLEGVAYSNHDIAKMFGKTFSAESSGDVSSAVVMKDITVFSYCEHHLAMMYDMHVNVAYIPRGRVLGLSKIARICDMAAKRLQLQERLGSDIAEIIAEAADTPDVGVAIVGSQDADTAVVMKDITVFSFCEHHFALMYDMKVNVAYIPNGRVIGLSKVGRIADMVAKRLQLQERIGQDIADILEIVLQTKDVAVIIEGKHACMTSRGVKKDSITRTSTLRGKFRENAMLRAEMINLIKHLYGAD